MNTRERIGDFEIIRQLGAGGMGIVYLARQVSLDRLVALKVLGSALTGLADKTRFRREAKAVAKLSHPSIASVHFVGQDDRLCYMAMEYIEGISLREVINRLSQTKDATSNLSSVVTAELAEPSDSSIERFDVDESHGATTVDRHEQSTSAATPEGLITNEALEIIGTTVHVESCCRLVITVAEALHHAHEKGVIHRDLKPENLMLDKEGQPHVIDFGVAKFLGDASMTQTGKLLGTILYMSPEQLTGRIELDQRTDIYSLGLVLYELLTLRKPVSDETRDGLLRRIISKPLLPITSLNEAVPNAVENVVHMATAKDADRRYRSLPDFVADLSSALRNEPTVARPYRYTPDVKEVLSRRPLLVTIAAIISCSAAFICFSVFAGVGGGILIDATITDDNGLDRFAPMAIGLVFSGTVCTIQMLHILRGRYAAYFIATFNFLGPIALLLVMVWLSQSVTGYIGKQMFEHGAMAVGAYSCSSLQASGMSLLFLALEPSRKWFREVHEVRKMK